VAAVVKFSQALIATATAVVMLAACSAPAQKAGTTMTTATTSSADKRGQWIELPFSVGKAATGIAITKAGDVYVGDVGRVYERDRAGYESPGRVPVEDLVRETGRVLLLEKGAAQQKVALDGVDTMFGIAVGADGAIYLATRKKEVLKFEKGTTTSTVLPMKFDEFNYRPSLSVDDAGTVYVFEGGGTALRLDGGATEPTQLNVLPTNGLRLAVTGGGDVYGLGALFGRAELRILTAGAGEPRGVVLTDLRGPQAMAVHGGDVYILDDTGDGVPQDDYATENLRIVKFNKAAIDSVAAPANPAELTELPKVASSAVIPFSPGKKGAYHDMTVAPNGDIYLTDGARVLKQTPA
jgi:hypothetical protein